MQPDISSLSFLRTKEMFIFMSCFNWRQKPVQVLVNDV